MTYLGRFTTNEQAQVLMIKGAISDLPESEQAKVRIIITRIDEMKTEFGEAAFNMAIALRGAQLLAEQK